MKPIDPEMDSNQRLPAFKVNVLTTSPPILWERVFSCKNIYKTLGKREGEKVRNRRRERERGREIEAESEVDRDRNCFYNVCVYNLLILLAKQGRAVDRTLGCATSVCVVGSLQGHGCLIRLLGGRSKMQSLRRSSNCISNKSRTGTHT